MGEGVYKELQVDICPRYGFIQCKLFTTIIGPKLGFSKFLTILIPLVKNVIKLLQTLCICFGRVHLCVTTGPILTY